MADETAPKQAPCHSDPESKSTEGDAVDSFLSDTESPQMARFCTLLLTLNVTALAAMPLLVSVLSAARHSFSHAVHYAIFMDAGLSTGMLVMAVASLLLSAFSAMKLESISVEIRQLRDTGNPNVDRIDELSNEEFPCQWRAALHQATGVACSFLGLAMAAALIFPTLVTL